jgi:hypothetical protein
VLRDLQVTHTHVAKYQFIVTHGITDILFKDTAEACLQYERFIKPLYFREHTQPAVGFWRFPVDVPQNVAKDTKAFERVTTPNGSIANTVKQHLELGHVSEFCFYKYSQKLSRYLYEGC